MSRRLLICLFSFFLVGAAFADYRQVPDVFHQIQGVTFFEGDRHGDFQHDFVAIFEDGSAWKIHPKDRAKFSRWDLGDTVHVSLRTKRYWFKREHKFELRNHNNNETVRAMLVQEAAYPVVIMDARIEQAGTRLQTDSFIDLNGNVYLVYYTVTDYDKVLYLSNGSIWIICNESSFDNFLPGDRVYFGVNMKKKSQSFFLIRGTEREAAWAWTYPYNRL